MLPAEELIYYWLWPTIIGLRVASAMKDAARGGGQGIGKPQSFCPVAMLARQFVIYYSKSSITAK